MITCGHETMKKRTLLYMTSGFIFYFNFDSCARADVDPSLFGIYGKEVPIITQDGKEKSILLDDNKILNV